MKTGTKSSVAVLSASFFSVNRGPRKSFGWEDDSPFNMYRVDHGRVRRTCVYIYIYTDCPTTSYSLMLDVHANIIVWMFFFWVTSTAEGLIGMRSRHTVSQSHW